MGLSHRPAPHPVSSQGLKPPASGSVDTYVKANLLPGASKVRPLLLPLATHPAWSSPLLECATGDPIRRVGPWELKKP